MVDPEREGSYRRFRAQMARLDRDRALQTCLVRDSKCHGPICRAHSVQNKRCLGSIERDGHVYMILPDADRPGSSRFRLVGRNQATTFTGFCSFHDTKLFSEIDEKPTSITVPSIAMHSYRAIAKELWNKLNTVKVHGELVRKVKAGQIDEVCTALGSSPRTFDRERFLYFMDGTLHGYRASAKRMQWRFNSLRVQIANDDYHLTETAHFEFNSPPVVGASVATTPEYDFFDKRIAALTPTGYQSELMVCIVPSAERTIVMAAYHKRDRKVLAPLIQQLEAMPIPNRGIALSKFLIVHGENAAFQPEYVDSLREQERRRIEVAFHESIYEAIPFGDVPNVDFWGTGQPRATQTS